MGGDLLQTREFTRRPCFNPRPRMGGDMSLLAGRWSRPWFQSTPPHGGRQLLHSFDPKSTEFQSTPPHGGRLFCEKLGKVQAGVSIHAPAWGATPTEVKPMPRKMFQSTPPHGGRHAQIFRTPGRVGGFNPRPRMGGDVAMKMQQEDQ